MDTIIFSSVVLAAIGILSAVVLYFVSQKFKVYEDPKIDEVVLLLPGANCGGCGFAGCRNFAENVVKNEGLNGLLCPPGGATVNSAIAAIFGGDVQEDIPKMTVVRCNGNCENAPPKAYYDSIPSCAYYNMVNAGSSGCSFGCLGCGDCVAACKFNAIHIDAQQGLPVINDACVFCGACKKACPRSIIDIIPRHEQGAVHVACMNKDKGGEAKKNCKVACIGCKKCEKTCEYSAITVDNNLALINGTLCTACKKCVEGCPAKAIHASA
ncbi:MAG: RnfABCDGE type electron transport complex subunit B [Bacteroidales bacterium]|jgi:Na+-translocating ferredoxin:NAD+ oxidoreductase RNF subunit RnfB|nr:RnfABCDGE type electron transport complex subunit B [Bacteroidales bacterium]